MKAFATLSKGKELEGEYSTREQAEAAMWCYDYYLGTIEEFEVTEEEFNALVAAEKEHAEAAHSFNVTTDFEKYQAFMKGMAA
jgi:hypothetical protein